MAANPRAASAVGARGVATMRKSYFEQQREILISDIALSFEQALANINKLNRSLEAVITVGNEFSAVEALWSQFEGVMAKGEEDIDKSAAQEPHQQEDHAGTTSRARSEDYDAAMAHMRKASADTEFGTGTEMAEE